MKRFLQSDQSLYCFSSSSLDLANIASMFNIRVVVFVFSSSGSIAPRWDWIHPNPELVMRIPKNYPAKDIHDLWLFHEDNCHYDLLVPRYFCGNIEENPKSCEENAKSCEKESDDLVSEEECEIETHEADPEHDPSISKNTVFSRIHFLKYPRRKDD